MSKTIQELQTYLEELEKRIKAMSKAHTTLELLIEINSYFDTVQHYLHDIEDSFNTHTANCNMYQIQIEYLQNQISTINSKLQNFSATGNENFDTTEINAKIENLTTKLNSLEMLLNNFIGNNTTTLDVVVNDISSLQTEVGDIQDQIDSINTEISSINENIGSMQTTITNLSSTQNSLSSAQNSMSANINSIDTRLTTAESNISALTGGIDVGALEDRISALESGENLPNYCHHRHYDYNYTPEDKTMYTLVHNFSCNINNKISQNFKLTYESTSSGELTIEVYNNFHILCDTIIVNLQNHPTTYFFSRDFLSANKHQTVQLKLTSTTDITYKSFDLWIYGYNSNIYELDRDLKICAVDNTIYITKYENGVFKYGKFSPTDSLDLNNLPNQVDAVDDEGNAVLSVFYAKNFDTLNSAYKRFENVYDCLYVANSNRKLKYITYDENGNQIKINKYMGKGLKGELFCDKYAFMIDLCIINDNPGLHIHRSDSEREYEIKRITGKWLYNTLIKDNNTSYSNTPVIFDKNLTLLSLHENGNLYYLKHGSNWSYVKIAKGGNSATGYYESDGSINVYINYNTHTDKYKLTLNASNVYEPLYISTLENCTYVYETYNNQIIKRTSNGWEIAELDY